MMASVVTAFTSTWEQRAPMRPNGRAQQPAQPIRWSPRFGGPLCLVAASRQQLECAGETRTNADCAEIPAISRQNAVHVSSLSNGDDCPIHQS